MLEDPSDGIVPPRQCLAFCGALAIDFCLEAEQSRYNLQAVEDHKLGILLREDDMATLGDEAGACQRRRSPVPSRDHRLECCDVALINVAPTRVRCEADLLQWDELGANLLRHLGVLRRRRNRGGHGADEPAQNLPAREGVVPNVRHEH